jgi:hypothetical protein
MLLYGILRPITFIRTYQEYISIEGIIAFRKCKSGISNAIRTALIFAAVPLFTYILCNHLHISDRQTKYAILGTALALGPYFHTFQEGHSAHSLEYCSLLF